MSSSFIDLVYPKFNDILEDIVAATERLEQMEIDEIDFGLIYSVDPELSVVLKDIALVTKRLEQMES